MSEHTKEPWEIWETIDSDGDHWISVSTPGIKTIRRMVAHITLKSESDQEDIANARRIVACVNACAGISTSLLERATPFDTALFFKAHCDELLEVVKYTRQVLPQDIWVNDLKVMLDTAISNAEKHSLDAGDKSL